MESRKTDRRGIPAISCRLPCLLQCLSVSGGNFLSTFLKHPFAVCGDQLLAGFDQRRERSFRIGAHGKIHVREALVILGVTFQEQLSRGNADQFRTGLDVR